MPRVPRRVSLMHFKAFLMAVMLRRRISRLFLSDVQRNVHDEATG